MFAQLNSYAAFSTEFVCNSSHCIVRNGVRVATIYEQYYLLVLSTTVHSDTCIRWLFMHNIHVQTHVYVYMMFTTIILAGLR